MKAKTATLPLLALAVFMAMVANASVYFINVENFQAPVYAKVYEQAVSVAANSTQTINITLPQGWTSSMIDAVIVTVKNATGSIDLSAKDSAGTVVASATVVPLSSGYQITLPPSTVTIELANSDTAAWNGTIVIYVQATAEFKLSNVPSQLNLQAGGSTSFSALVEQVSGPAGLLYWTSEVTKNGVATSDISVSYYWAANGQQTVETTGAGWTGTVVFSLTASPQAAGQYSMKLTMYYEEYSSGSPSNPIAEAAITGVVDLAGPTSASLPDWMPDFMDKSKLVAGGIIIIVILAFLILLLAKR